MKNIVNIVCVALISFGIAGVHEVNAENSTATQTFKRIKVKKRPAGQMINIQIEASTANAWAEAARPTSTRVQPKSEGVSWFWDGVTEDLASASPKRMDLAVQQVRNADTAKAQLANTERLREIALKYGADILLGTLGKKISPAFVLAVIGVESGGRSKVVSGAGAVGLMQLIPATADRFGVKDTTDPRQNISGGAQYLEWLLSEFNNDPILALAGYNAGEGSVRKHKGVPPYKETRAYVPKVVAAWDAARALCKTPPKTVTDGCVFKVEPK